MYFADVIIVYTHPPASRELMQHICMIAVYTSSKIQPINLAMQ